MFDPMIRSFVVVNDCPRGRVCVEKPLVDPLISTLSDINDCPKGQVGVKHMFLTLCTGHSLMSRKRIFDVENM